MNFKPLGNRVLVERETKKEEKHSSGIIIPDTAKEESFTGKVVEVGNGEKVKESQIKKGDEVLFESFGFTEVKLGSKDYIVLDIDRVIGIYK